MKSEMGTNQRTRGFLRFSAVAVCVMVAGCAAITPPTPEDAVRARAQQRWKALIAGDMPAAYEMLSPSARKLKSLAVFRGDFGAAGTWQSASVGNVDCDQPGRCEATVKIVFQPLLLRQRLGVVESSYKEVWVLEDGQWWFAQPQ